MLHFKVPVNLQEERCGSAGGMVGVYDPAATRTRPVLSQQPNRIVRPKPKPSGLAEREVEEWSYCAPQAEALEGRVHEKNRQRVQAAWCRTGMLVDIYIGSATELMCTEHCSWSILGVQSLILGDRLKSAS